MAARRIWRDVANVVWYYITHLQAEINNRTVYIRNKPRGIPPVEKAAWFFFRDFRLDEYHTLR